MVTTKEMKEKLIAAIQEQGIEESKKDIFGTMEKMAAAHAVSEMGITVFAFVVVNPELLETGAEYIIGATNDPEKKRQLQELYNYWRVNREGILRLYRLHNK